MTTHIERITDGSTGEYRATLEGSDATAKLSWTERGGVRHAEHTFVPPEFRGKGVAAELVKALIEDAREQGFTIAPDCSYVESYFNRHKELAELRA